MSVSAKVDYACRALLELASHHGSGQPVSLRQITADHDMPAQFLFQILGQLKSAGLITSTRGAAGGYRLAKSPAEVSLWDVVSAIDGEPTSITAAAEETPFARCLQQVWNELSEARQSCLCGTSLQDLVDAARSEAGSMYYI